MKLPAYPRTKPSGVEWLGDVPEHWEVKRLKYVSDISTSGVWGENPDSDDEGYPVATTANISPQGDFDVPGMQRRLLSIGEARKGLCRAGDTVVVKSSGSATNVISGKCGLVRPEHGKICFGNFTLRVRPDPSKLHPYFTWAFLSSALVKAQVRLMVSTTTYPNLQVPEYISFLVPLPPLAEQQRICSFLGRETERIDRLVNAKQKLVERLREKGAALVSRTVTRGLPAAEARAAGLPAYPRTKPSGVEWLGDVPEHWEVKRLKYVSDISTSGVWGEDPDSDDEGYPVATTANISPQGDFDVPGMQRRLLSIGEARKGLCRAGDTVVVKSSGSATNVISGKCGLVRPEHGKICFGNFTLRVRPDPSKLHPYFTWAFLSSALVKAQVRLMVSTTTYPNLQVPEYISFLVPLPPLAEQAAIAAYLDEETAKLDALVGKVEEAVERLQEYRTALITAAVTGKVDVRKESDG